MDFTNKILLGDCDEVLKEFPDNSVDLIFTSPPYADCCADTYGEIHQEKYTDYIK